MADTGTRLKKLVELRSRPQIKLLEANILDLRPLIKEGNKVYKKFLTEDDPPIVPGLQPEDTGEWERSEEAPSNPSWVDYIVAIK